MSNDSGKDKLLEVVYSPKLMSIVSIFPVDNPDVEFFERRNGAVTVNIAPLRREWAYGKIPRLILLYSRSLIMERSEKLISTRRPSSLMSRSVLSVSTPV